MALEDLAKIRELRRRQSHLFESVPLAREPKRIVLYTMDPWQLGVVEQFLHLAFIRKGHKPTTVYYDGLLPICGWENHQVAPPNPEVLAKRFDFVFDCFGISPIGISNYLDKSAAELMAHQIVDSTSDARLHELTYRGIAVGAVCLRDLFQYSLGHFEPRTRADFDRFRLHMLHAIMSVDLAYAIIEREQPHVVVLVNGKLVMYSYMYEVCRHVGVPVTTWEEGMYFDTSIVLAHDDRAIDFPVDAAVWEGHKRQPLTREQSEKIDQYFSAWRSQTATAYKYYNNEERDFDRIRNALSLPRDKRLFSIFTNIVWDTNALGKDRAFGSMMDWVNQTIDLIGSMKNAVLVVRAHPGESKWQFKTRTPVRAMIAERYGGQLPAHIRVVDADSELSSYEIARHSERCAVYTSTLGIELTLMGLGPLVCGVPFYSRRGFTNDVDNLEQYKRLMTGVEKPMRGDPEVLRRFMHLVLFELVKQPEFFVGIHDTPQTPKVHLESFEGFPQSLPVFNGIVDCILERRGFMAPAKSSSKTLRKETVGVCRDERRKIEYLPGEDPGGKLFIEDGELYRGLTGPHVEFYRGLLNNGSIAELTDAGLVDTKLADRSHKEFELIVRHERIWPVTFPFEWPVEQFKASALFFCQFARRISRMGIGLKDAHGYNILFDQSHRPRFIDFCSLVPIKETNGRVHPEFNRYFLNPLYLMQAGRHTEARNLVNLGGYETGSRRGGVDNEKLLSWLSEASLCRFNEFRQRERALRESARFDDLLTMYEEEIAAIEFSVKQTCWSSYYDTSKKYPTNRRFASFDPAPDWQPKQRQIHDLLKSIHGETVLDVGCSAGWFSKLAASFGKRVIAMDSDEAAISRLYGEVSSQGLPICPIYCDFPEIKTICIPDSPKNIKRFAADVVLACALIHHLVFKARMSIAEVVETMAELTKSVLVIEFLGDEDESIRQFRREGDVPGYSAEALTSELRKRFRTIDHVDSTGNFHRSLFICRDKIAPPRASRAASRVQESRTLVTV